VALGGKFSPFIGVKQEGHSLPWWYSSKRSSAWLELAGIRLPPWRWLVPCRVGIALKAQSSNLSKRLAFHDAPRHRAWQFCGLSVTAGTTRLATDPPDNLLVALGMPTASYHVPALTAFPQRNASKGSLLTLDACRVSTSTERVRLPLVRQIVGW